MLKKHTLLISIAYTISLLAVSLIRLDFSEIETIIPSFADKVFHFGAYGVLTGVWFYTFNYRYNMSRIKALLIISTACIAFGIIIEVLQKELTNTRYFDWYDILANVGGVLLATYLVLFFKKSDVK